MRAGTSRRKRHLARVPSPELAEGRIKRSSTTARNATDVVDGEFREDAVAIASLKPHADRTHQTFIPRAD